MEKEDLEIQACLYEDSCHNPSIQAHFIDGAEWAEKKIIEKACELYKEEIKQMKCLLNHFSKGAGELIDLERSLEIFKQGLTNP